MSARRGGAAAAAATVLVAVLGVFGLHQASLPNGLYETKRTLWPAYQAVPRTWDSWGPKTDLGYRIDTMAERLSKHRGGYQLRQGGTNDWSTTRPLVKTMGVLQDRMTHAKVGAVWYVKAKVDQYQEKIRKLDLNPAVAMATEGTDPIDIVVGTMRLRHPTIHLISIYACRTILGSNQLSQHAYANAADMSGAYSEMDRAAHDMLNLVRKDFIPVSQILWNYKNLLSGNYVYDHTDHIHFSGDPLLSGSCRHASLPGAAPGEPETEFTSPPPDLGATGPTGE